MGNQQRTQTVIRFGSFEADLHTQELRRGGTLLRLPSQSFQVLQMLLERRGTLVTRDELRAVLWTSDTFVDFDHGLHAAVNRLREALGDSADSPRWRQKNSWSSEIFDVVASCSIVAERLRLSI